MKVLNLGCGTSPSAHEDVTNIDWSLYLRLRRSPLLSVLARMVLKGERLQKLSSLPDNIRVHNLAKGIPFPDESVDVVYHSHVLEHLDRDAVPAFLSETWRVLKPGGVHRIVVPDFEKRCRLYVNHLAVCDDSSEAVRHDEYVASILEQSVRKEGFGSAQQAPMRRRIENLILGDARKRGETHQWMYDRINLEAKLKVVGFQEIVLQQFNVSLIPSWGIYGLDLDMHKENSLYMDAVK